MGKNAKNRARRRRADFRKGKQSATGLAIAKYVNLGSNLAAVTVAVIVAASDASEKVWSATGLLLTAIGLALYMCFPQYFSAFDEQTRQRLGYTERAFMLTPTLLAPTLAMTLKTFTVMHVGKLWLLVLFGVVLGAGITALLCAFSRELHENRRVWASVCAAVMICAMGSVGQINHLFNVRAKAETVMYTVTETGKDSQGKRSQYYCIALSPEGELMQFPIQGARASRLKPDDIVWVYEGTGALGIDYAYLLMD